MRLSKTSLHYEIIEILAAVCDGPKSPNSGLGKITFQKEMTCLNTWAIIKCAKWFVVDISACLYQDLQVPYFLPYNAHRKIE